MPMIHRHQEDTSGRRPTPEVRIVHLNGPTFRALAEGDLEREHGQPCSRLGLLCRPGLARCVADAQQTGRGKPGQRGVGHRRHLGRTAATGGGRAGYHGPPDQRGWWRLATRSTRRTGDVATPARRSNPCCSVPPMSRRFGTVRVTISPDNLASYELASQCGFIEVGQQWDDEDGLEIVYELAAVGCRHPLFLPLIPLSMELLH